MDSELAGANRLRPAEGTVPLRQPNTPSHYPIYYVHLGLKAIEKK